MIRRNMKKKEENRGMKERLGGENERQRESGKARKENRKRDFYIIILIFIPAQI